MKTQEIQAWFKAIATAALLSLSCSEGSDTAGPSARPAAATGGAAAAPPVDEAEAEPVDLVSLGESAYKTNCIACHHPDPKLDGVLGPAVAGASESLLEARIVHGTYPEGYTPKRDTRNMVPMPFLEPKIPALAAYLASEG